MYILGFDIGGTKCAAVTAEWDGVCVRLLQKEVCATDHDISADAMLDRLILMADGILDRRPDRIGISCGGPLDAARGVILSPPNLPGWDHVAIVARMKAHYGVVARLQNDANACALAEWRFGAGRGCKNMIFLTFGTGLGAGLILDGRLYGGTNGNAGEIGHVRMESDGPVGYGKHGSLEGFCSGGGIAQLGERMAAEAVAAGEAPSYVGTGGVTARTVADAAFAGDATAKRVYRCSGEYLGRGLSLLIDLLNPEAIVIGSIYTRAGALLSESMQAAIEREALPASAAVCKILPAMLGEQIGDYAAIATAVGEV